MITRATALLWCVLLAACHTTPHAEPPRANPPDQSSVFFPTHVDTYGLDLPQTDREHLAELHALRQIDPCGFVDEKTLIANGRPDASYAPTSVQGILADGISRIAVLGGDGCTIAFPATPTALKIQVFGGEPRATDPGFTSQPAHPEVSAKSSPYCWFRVHLPLARMANAPANMRDPSVEVTPVDLATRRLAYDDTALCALAQTIALGIVAQVRDRGVPIYSIGDSVAAASLAAKFLTADPCAAASALRAAGFEWMEPAPEAQWATTWRHPSVCSLLLQQPVGDAFTPSAIVKNGLADWSNDGIVESLAGEVPTRTEREGFTLFTFGAGCFVVGKSNATIAPSTVGAGAPELVAPTPVVTVRLAVPDVADCLSAQDTAVAALKRAT